MLTKEAIIEAEKNHDAACGTCKGELSYNEHKQALAIKCYQNPKKNNKFGKELHKFLVSIKSKLIKNNLDGAVLVKCF